MKGQRKSKSNTLQELVVMGISDRIEAFILELMKQEQDDWLKIQRNELAQIFGCVPSQINYVIATRFNPEKGYIVESRRGGGGWVKIKRINGNGEEIGTLHIAADISERDACECISELLSESRIDPGTAKVMSAAVSDKALAEAGNRGRVRASILKNMLEAAFEKK